MIETTATAPGAATRPMGFAAIAAAVVAPVRKVGAYFARELAIANAERHLERVNDQILRDIGVHRSDIHLMVRQSRKMHGRRDP